MNFGTPLIGRILVAGIPSDTSDAATSAERPGRERPENGSPTGVAAASSFLRSYFTPAGRLAAWNLGWLIAGTMVSQGCGLVVVLLLTQVLGPQQFGVYAFAMTLHGYMMLIGAAGMGPVVIRELTRRPGDADTITTAYLMISFTASLLVAMVSIIGVRLAPVSADEMFLITCIAIGHLTTGARMVPFFDARHRQAAAVVVTSLTDLVWLTGIVALFAADQLTIRTAGELFLLRWATSSVAVLLLHGVLFGWPRLRFSRREIQDMLGSSWHLLVTQFTASIPLTSGVVIVRLFDGESAAGVMGLAVLVLQTVLQLVALALRIVYPHITGPFGFEKSFQRKLWTFFLGYLAVLILAALLAVVILVSWFLSPEYAGVLPTSVIMLVGGVLLACAMLLFQSLVAEHRERVVSQTQLVSAATFVVLAFPAAAQWSCPGVAASFCVFALLSLGLSSFFRKRRAGP